MCVSCIFFEWFMANCVAKFLQVVQLSLDGESVKRFASFCVKNFASAGIRSPSKSDY